MENLSIVVNFYLKPINQTKLGYEKPENSLLEDG